MIAPAHRRLALAAALAVAGPLALAACTDPAQAPAEAALEAAGRDLQRLSAAVERLAPEETAAARRAQAAAQALAGRGDWKGALAGAEGVSPRVHAALTAAESARALETARWAQATRDLPNLLYAVEDRLDDLRGGQAPPGGRPAGLAPGALQAAQADLAALTAGWTRAQALAAGGDVAAGLAEAQALAIRARELHARLGGPAAPP